MWGRWPTLEQQLQRELEARQSELLRPLTEPQEGESEEDSAASSD